MYASSWCESSLHFAVLHAEHEQIIPDFEIHVSNDLSAHRYLRSHAKPRVFIPLVLPLPVCCRTREPQTPAQRQQSQFRNLERAVELPVR